MQFLSLLATSPNSVADRLDQIVSYLINEQRCSESRLISEIMLTSLQRSYCSWPPSKSLSRKLQVLHRYSVGTLERSQMIDRSCGLSNGDGAFILSIHNEFETVLSKYSTLLILSVFSTYSASGACRTLPLLSARAVWRISLEVPSPERGDKMELVDPSTSRHLWWLRSS